MYKMGQLWQTLRPSLSSCLDHQDPRADTQIDRGFVKGILLVNPLNVGSRSQVLLDRLSVISSARRFRTINHSIRKSQTLLQMVDHVVTMVILRNVQH